MFGASSVGVPITPLGSEPTATVPAPLVPQDVEVALGKSGGTLTLITTEASGFTRNGEVFATGTDVMAEANGSTSALTLYRTT